MNIYQLNKYVTCILMYNHNRGMLTNIFNDMFMKHTASHNYNMRQHITYKIPHYKTNTRQNTLAYAASELWNTVTMKNQAVHNQLQTYLLQNRLISGRQFSFRPLTLTILSQQCSNALERGYIKQVLLPWISKVLSIRYGTMV